MATHASKSYEVSYSAVAAQLPGFFEGYFALFVDIGGKIDEVDAARGLLAFLDADNRQRNIASMILRKNLSKVRCRKKSRATDSSGITAAPLYWAISRNAVFGRMSLLDMRINLGTDRNSPPA